MATDLAVWRRTAKKVQASSCVSGKRKKSTKINFFGPETAQSCGGLPREGVVAEKFAPSLESLSSLGFEEGNLGCPGPLGVFKKFVQIKKLV